MSQTSDLQPALWQILELKCLRLQIPSAWYFGSTPWECQEFSRQLPMRVNWSEYDWLLASLLNVMVIRWGVKMKKKTAVKRLVRECAMIARTPDTDPNQLNDSSHHWAVCIADSSWVINCFHEVQLEGDIFKLIHMKSMTGGSLIYFSPHHQCQFSSFTVFCTYYKIPVKIHCKQNMF